jgi:hypothetical protein
MIRNKRIVISFGIIVVILVYLILSNLKWKSGDIPTVKKLDSTDEIVISKQDKQISIISKNNKWLINKDEFPADPEIVSKLEKEINDLRITDFISKGPHYFKYDLSPEKAIRVIAKKAGAVKRDILVGKASSTNRNTYIKFADNGKVYLADGNLFTEYNKEIDELRDKRIYKVERKDIEWIELTYQGAKLTFDKKTEEVEVSPEPKAKADSKDSKDIKDIKEKKKRTTEKWICREFKNSDLDTNKINTFADAFSSIRADSYPDIEKKNIQGMVCRVRGKVYGKEIELVINSNKDKENYYCTSSESPYIFILRDYEAKKYFKSLNDFKAEVPKKSTSK